MGVCMCMVGSTQEQQQEEICFAMYRHLLLSCAFIFLFCWIFFFVGLCPFTKVEESFNMQAVHDLLHIRQQQHQQQHQQQQQDEQHQHQQQQQNDVESIFLPSEASLISFDHRFYPGEVPRTFIGPLLLSRLVLPLLSLPRIFHDLLMTSFSSSVVGIIPFSLTIDNLSCLLLLRAVLSFIITIALFYLLITLLRSSVIIPFSFLLLLSVSFHFIFYSSRLLPNTFALLNLLFSLPYLLPHHPSPPHNVSLHDALHPSPPSNVISLNITTRQTTTDKTTPTSDNNNNSSGSGVEKRVGIVGVVIGLCLVCFAAVVFRCDFIILCIPLSLELFTSLYRRQILNTNKLNSNDNNSKLNKNDDNNSKLNKNDDTTCSPSLSPSFSLLSLSSSIVTPFAPVSSYAVYHSLCLSIVSVIFCLFVAVAVGLAAVVTVDTYMWQHTPFTTTQEQLQHHPSHLTSAASCNNTQQQLDHHGGSPENFSPPSDLMVPFPSPPSSVPSSPLSSFSLLNPTTRMLWPEGHVFLFNAVSDGSSAWGTSPWHWYFTNGMPRYFGPLLLLFCPLIICWILYVHHIVTNIATISPIPSYTTSETLKKHTSKQVAPESGTSQTLQPQHHPQKSVVGVATDRHAVYGMSYAIANIVHQVIFLYTQIFAVEQPLEVEGFRYGDYVKTNQQHKDNNNNLCQNIHRWTSPSPLLVFSLSSRSIVVSPVVAAVCTATRGWWIWAFPVLALSALPHKEMRFVLPSLCALSVYATIASAVFLRECLCQLSGGQEGGDKTAEVENDEQQMSKCKNENVKKQEGNEKRETEQKKKPIGLKRRKLIGFLWLLCVCICLCLSALLCSFRLISSIYNYPAAHAVLALNASLLQQQKRTSGVRTASSLQQIPTENRGEVEVLSPFVWLPPGLRPAKEEKVDDGGDRYYADMLRQYLRKTFFGMLLFFCCYS
eukprot:GHVS01033102.1.p1 GENE.GHVS01033102.1~~GHVS01033102.1.p1  ORF type:complete len:941 (+),score=226.31 GHVS01033102.1:111-2933(+)